MEVDVPSMGASWMIPWLSQKVSKGLWLYSLAWALRCTFIFLAMFCLLMTFTLNVTGSPAMGALSKVRKTATPLYEPAQWEQREPVHQMPWHSFYCFKSDQWILNYLSVKLSLLTLWNFLMRVLESDLDCNLQKKTISIPVFKLTLCQLAKVFCVFSSYSW